MGHSRGLSTRQAATKRAIDVLVAGIALVVLSPVLAVAWVVATIDTRANGIFRQTRIGRDGEEFTVYKMRTMREVSGHRSTVTTRGDRRITRSGAVMRSLKIDELPQLVNVLRGEMSLVGPRPDVPGFADLLEGEDRIVLSVRPGITGPATLAYRHEEALLAKSGDSETYNRETIWPDKVRINRAYVEHYSLLTDLRCLAATVRSVFDKDSADQEDNPP
jgi:lipopolysaccharide/colanic/teichoic acid biosynthesis glycosyltransferase